MTSLYSLPIVICEKFDTQGYVVLRTTHLGLGAFRAARSSTW